MTHDFDVIVVGAGPAGLTLALLLARRGHRIALMEKWPQPYPLPRAIGLDHEARRIWYQAGMDERLEKLLLWNKGLEEAQWVSADLEVLLHMPSRARAPSGWPDMVGFSQPDVEEYLGQLANEHPNIKLMRNVHVEGFERFDGGVDVNFRSGAGNGRPDPEAPVRRISGKFLVGCDGANSIVAALLGTEFTSLDFSSTWLVVDIQPTVEREWKPYLAEVLDPNRPTTIAPAGPRMRRFEFMLMPEETKESMSKPEMAWKLVEKWGVTPANAELVRSVAYTFQGCWANKWSVGRIAIAGDAAHLTPPFLGQGLNSAVRDSANLAVHLDLILRGVSPLSSLDRYTEERLPHARALIEKAVELGRAICITDPVQAQGRDAGLRHMRDSKQVPLASPGMLVAGVLADNDRLAGALSHQGRVENGSAHGFFDEVCVNGAFVLIARDGDPQAYLGPEAAGVWKKLGGVGFHVSANGPVRDVEGVYESWMGDAGVVLIRPDYYVFGSGKSVADADRLVLALAAKLGMSDAESPQETARMANA